MGELEDRLKASHSDALPQISSNSGAQCGSLLLESIESCKMLQTSSNGPNWISGHCQIKDSHDSMQRPVLTSYRLSKPHWASRVPHVVSVYRMTQLVRPRTWHRLIFFTGLQDLHFYRWADGSHWNHWSKPKIWEISEPQLHWTADTISW